ncbi:MAG: ATP-binding cassette domain-containing protein [Holosporales bacterium]|jgi:putative ABC transport system ATP-binding protein|nr:ATP-binding cassette domain-containing protein [Holosporales bacterium]
MLRLSGISIRNTLRGLDLTVGRDEFVLVIGANGAGKTTLFNIISGAAIPAAGKIFFNDRDVTALPQHKRAKWISSVLQDPRQGTVAEMTILENLALSYMRNSHKRITKSTVELFKKKLSVLEMNLENRLSERAGDLSGGQRQALSLIMATVADYDLLLLDEITSSLDQKNSLMVMRIAEKVVTTEKKACMLITHDANHIKYFNGRVLEMKNGALASC